MWMECISKHTRTFINAFSKKYNMGVHVREDQTDVTCKIGNEYIVLLNRALK